MKFSFSNLAIILVFATALIIDLDLKNWQKLDRVIEHDVHSYYAYLPAIFIYDDITIEKSDYRFGDYFLFWIKDRTEDGKGLIKTTSGLSILYSPFFFIAHAIALSTDYPENGFSEPYKVLLLISALVYLVVGLIYTKKILRLLNFSDKHTAITLLLLGWGTNLLAYASQSGTNVHVYSFTLVAAFIYYTIKWHEKPSYKITIYIGLLSGLISLVRPSNLLIVIFFILYGINSISDIKQKFIFYKKEFFKLVLILPLILIVWSPQFWYWKIITGNFLSYSYGDERFYFLDPKIFEGLFSFRKGWFIYTPVMLFSIIGFFLMPKRLLKVRIGVIVFTIVNIYVIFSWWCWWYGGTFGQRSMVDSYALLAIPIAAFLKYIDGRKIYNYLFYGLCVFFVWLNIFQTYQFEYGSLHHDSMSKKLYIKQFGKMDKIPEFNKYLDWANYKKARYRNVELEEKAPITKDKKIKE